MSTRKSFKVLASVSPNLGIAAVPHGQMKIRSSLDDHWDVAFTVIAGELEIHEWTLRMFGSYSVAFNAAARKALEIAIERDLIVVIVKEVTDE